MVFLFIYFSFIVTKALSTDNTTANSILSPSTALLISRGLWMEYKFDHYLPKVLVAQRVPE